MNLLKFHALIYEIIYEKVLKLVLIPNDISCMIHGSLTSSVSPVAIFVEKCRTENAPLRYELHLP